MGGDLAAPKRPVALTMDLMDKGFKSEYDRMWLGGYKPTNGDYAWVPSSRNVTEWAAGEPNNILNGNDMEGCIHYWPTDEAPAPFIADEACTNLYGFICQKD